MNIKGFQFLVDNNFPILGKTCIFRDLSEVPQEIPKEYGAINRLILVGFDDRTDIYAHPYGIKKFRAWHFPASLLKENFEKINSEMEKEGLPLNNRIFVIGRSFPKEDAFLTGMALKEDLFVLVDMFEGLRPSGIDWNPHFSFKIPIINGKFCLGEFSDFKYFSFLKQICLDLKKFLPTQKPYLDFGVVDGKLFYHDLCFLKPKV